MARSNHGDDLGNSPGQQYSGPSNSAQRQQQDEVLNDRDDDRRSVSPQSLGHRRTVRLSAPQPRHDDESGDDELNSPPRQPRSRSRAGRRSILYNPREQEDDVIDQIAENESVLAWGVRFCRMIEEYCPVQALNTFTIWDSDVALQMRQMLSRQVFKSSIADMLVKYPRARLSHLKYLPWWREQVQQRFDVYAFDQWNQAKLITARRPHSAEIPDARPGGPPAPRDNLSEGSDDDLAARRQRETTINTTQSTGSDISKKIRKETLGIFDPDNPDDKDHQGLITTSSGKTIYTDVHMFCEHLYLFKRFGEFSLTEYYVGMLAGKASAWLMSELDGASRGRFLNLPVTEFGRKLTERFKRPDTEILEDLQRTRFTPKLVLRGVTLAQWAQRKASLARQVGYNKDHTVVLMLFNQIDIEISRFLEFPKDTATLTGFIQQCEQRRTIIEHFCRRSCQGDKGEHRYKSDRYSSGDKSSRFDRRSRNERSGSEQRDERDRLKRDDRRRNDQPSRSYTDNRKQEEKAGDRRRGDDRDRHSRSRDNDYIRRDVKEEKKVHFERKYPAIEEDEEEFGPDRADTNSDSESVCSSQSTSSQQAYFTHMTGGVVPADIMREFPCSVCHRVFPSRTVLWEHGAARSCIGPAQLASEQAPAKSKRCIHCYRDFPSRNKLHRHLKSGCSGKPVEQETILHAHNTGASTNDELSRSHDAIASMKEVSARVHHRPQVCEVDGNYTHLKFDAMGSPGGETASVCADTGCGKPVISREWLQTLEHSIEKKTPVFIRGVNDKVGKPHSEWATFTFYVNGIDCDGSDAGYAEFTCGAWIQDGMPSSSPKALLGNGWMAPYGINVMTTDKRLHCTSLEDFFIPFTISQLSRKVNRRVTVARPTTVPAGQTRLVPATWKEVPKGRTYMFNGCVNEASDAFVNSSSAPGVVIVNNTDKDITYQRKQKLGNIEECEEDQMYFSSSWKAAGLALLATAGLMASGASDGTAGGMDRVAISSEISLTPEISAVAAGELIPQAMNSSSTSISEAFLTGAAADPMRDVGSAILQDIEDSELPYKQQKKNKRKMSLSTVGRLLKLESSALDELALASSADGGPELVVRESIPESPQVPYQVHVQRQPNLPEIETREGIHIYDNGSGFAKQAQDLCTKYATLWIDSGLIHVPEDELMMVPLVDNWHEQRVAQRPYACGLKDRNLIDQIFDKLHDQKRMEWVTKPTPFAAPVFVVWRIVDGKPKGRAVVDLRALNKVTISDSYPLPRQEDIIAALRGATHISAIDASSFFFQFGVALEHRDRFTITSHRGLERSTVAPMGFCNSPAYAQRYMDRLLRPYRSFCRAFIDDIVIFSKSAAEHARHMDTLFGLFVSKNLSISPTKSWIGYPSAQVLGFRVDALGLSTTAERVAAFAKLEFPRQLAALEQYIGATGYIRHLIPYYAKIMEPLQKRKVTLLAEGRKNDKIVDGNKGKRKSYTKTTYYDPTPAEKIAFQTIQEQIAAGKGLVHLDPKKRLFLQLDASIQRGFGAVLYHVKDGYIWKEGTHIPSNVVMPICFISKTLTAAETRYGPTELEMAALVWAMKRLKAHVGSSEGFLTVFTDHSATKQIVEKTTLDTTSTDRANRRLVNASIYLSEYELRVFHIPGKKNFIPDALSRLEAPETDGNARRLRPDYTALDDVCMGVESLMSDETKNKFIQGYIDDTKYLPILKMILDTTDKPVDADRLHGEDAVSASKRGVPFALKDGLLYHEQTDGYLRLCVPHAMIDEILKMAHEDQNHLGTERMTRELSGLSIHNLTARIRKHIHGCKTCCLGQTDRQQRIGNYMPIRTPVTPMHTITIDFITDLPPVSSVGSPWAIKGFDLFDQLMTVTCAASKRSLLIPGYSTYSAEDWAVALSRMLLLADWGIPKVIISDRDRKFTSPFWRKLWSEFGCRLAMTTAYHPEADGLSERRNQTVEVALRFYYIENPLADWSHILPALQWNLNGAYNAGTKTSAHEFLYGFKPKSALDLVTPMEDVASLPYLREVIRKEAQLAMDFAAMKGKRWYDDKHRPITLKEGDRVYLRLHEGYNLPGKPSKKWSQQRTGPFRIKRVVNDLAYELELPDQWKIHPVISVKHLLPAHADDFINEQPGPVEGEPIDENRYEVDFIVKRQVRRLGRNATPFEGFLVRWKGWGPEHDQWVKTADMSEELVESFRKKHPEQFADEGLRRSGRTKKIPKKINQGN